MKRVVHRLGLSTAVAAITLGLGAFGQAPASADDDIVTVAAFTGTAHINCFGCGSSPGTAELTGVDPGVGTELPEGDEADVETATATYTAFEGTGATCVITGTATGSVTGELTNVSFNWTRVGATAVITTAGEINGAGVAVFVVTSPTGVPCGSAVDARFAGVVAGTSGGD